MNAYRLIYRGDGGSRPPIDKMVNNAILVDIMKMQYSDTAYSTTFVGIDADGLHPAGSGIGAYWSIFRAATAPFNGNSSRYIGSLGDSDKLIAGEVAGNSGAHYPRSLSDIQNSGLYDFICPGTITLGNGTSYIDFAFQADGLDTTTSCAKMWGAASGAAYGLTTAPGFCYDDIIVVYKSDGTNLITPMRRLPDSNAGGYLRWFSSIAPDGGAMWPSSLVGAKIEVYRHKYNLSKAGEYMLAKIKSSGLPNLVLPPKYYRVQITAQAAGSVNIQGMGAVEPGAGDFNAHTLAATDVLCWAGADDGINGLTLTGATFSAGTKYGEKVITLASKSFDIPTVKQALVFSAN